MFTEIAIACIRLYTYLQYWICIFYNRFIKDSFVYDVTNNIVYDIRSVLVDYKVEPPYPYWSVSCYDGRFKEHIVHVMGIVSTRRHFDDLLRTFVQNDLPRESTYLFIMKVGDTAISRIYDKDREDYLISDEKSRKHLLSIEYSHPLMDSSIVIELDPALYIIGNEVLSSVFVERYLEYQDQPFVFGYDYKLEIMDSRIKTFVLTYNQHIVFGKTDYQVVRA